MLAGVLIFAAGVFVMILVHELGHFITAKRFGIKVEQFFIGFGPRLWSFRRGETEYGLKGIPLGGYVRIAGMNPFQEPAPEDRDRVFTAKPAWQRAVVLVSGALTHFVLAFLLLLTFFWFLGVPILGGVEIVGVERELDGRPSPAAVAGLRAGDRVLELEGVRVESVDQFSDQVNAHTGEEITLVVDRGGERVTLRAVPTLARSGRTLEGRLGVAVTVGLLGRDRSGPVEGITDAAGQVGRLSVLSIRAIGQVFGPEGLSRVSEVLLGDAPRRETDPVGLVGAARFSGQAVAAGQIDTLLFLFAAFNVFVGILNLLPLPPLDGGHLAVLGFEAVTRRRIDPRKLVPITALVAGYLLFLTAAILLLDVTSPIPNPFQ